MTPPPFVNIADDTVKSAFVGGRPEVVRWLTPGTRLFKWTQSVTTQGNGVTPWWQFVDPQVLSTGSRIPGIGELQTRAARLNVSDRDFARVRMAVQKEWNAMTNLAAYALTRGAWGYIGKASGQRISAAETRVYFIGGEYQVWIPGLDAAAVIPVTVSLQ